MSEPENQPQVVPQQVINPVHHHYLITIVGMLIMGIVGYFIATRTKDKTQQAMQETNTTPFQTYGNAAQAHGTVVDYALIAKLTKGEMAPELYAAINKQNATINQLSIAVGRVDGKIENLKPPTVMERQTDGSFKTVLEQNRGTALPPLTSVSLDYNAKDPNMKTALQGKWIPYVENFKFKSIKYTGPAGGSKAAAEIERTVTNSDGTQVGPTENIPIVTNEAFFLKDDFVHLAPFPKYTFTLDTVINLNDGKKGYDFNSTKWMSRNWGINTGFTKVGPEKLIKFGASINVGHQ